MFSGLVLGSCASAPKSYGEPVYEEAAEEYAAAPQAMPADMEYSEDERSFSNSMPDEVQRIVIKNASISIVVDDPTTTLDAVNKMAEDLGGFVVSANLYQRELENDLTVTQASVTIRVPAEKLNQALGQIRGSSEQDPLNESIESQDVTRDYVDQKSRLRNLEKTEAQLLKIMEEADETEDVLAVYSELARVQEQIEVTKGQIQYYEQSAAMSIINIEILPNEAVQPLTIGGWQPVGVAKSAVQALINALTFIVDAAIWIIIFILPVLLVLFVIFVVPLYLILRVIRRRRKNSKNKENLQEIEKSETE
jgi:hypothetical protein